MPLEASLHDGLVLLQHPDQLLNYLSGHKHLLHLSVFLVLLLVEVDSPYELLPPQLHMLSEGQGYRLQIFLLVLI